MVDNEGIWSRGGSNVEELPDPFAPAGPPPGSVPVHEQIAKPRRRRWPLVLYAISAILLVTLIWLIVTAPLSRALEPLDDPAILLVSQEGLPIARRGAIKEAPVDVAQARPADSGRLRRDRGPPLLPPLGHRPARDRPCDGRQHAGPAASARAAATITQQLAKTSFLSSDRSLKRKAQEVIIAFWLEAWLTKDEILSRYLSSVYFGDGVYGLRAASHALFRPRAGKADAGPVGNARGRGPGAVAARPDAQSRARAGAQPAGAARRWPTPARSAAARASATTPAQAGPRKQRRFRPAPISPTGSHRGARRVRGGLRRGEGPDDARCRPSAARRAGRSPAPPIGNAQAALVAMRPDGRVVAMVGGQELQGQPVQPRDAGAPPAGIGVQAVRLSRRAPRRLDARQHDRGPADHHRRLDPGQQRRRLSRRDHACAKRSPARATRRRCACRRASAAPMSCAPPASSGSPRRFRIRPAWRSAPRASACSS